MDGFLEHQLICRACLRIVENKTQSFGYIEDVNGNLKDMIMCCVPEMDIYVSSHPIMCFPCIQVLITVYNFKTRCLNTETIIRSYIQRNNLIEYNHVNLSCVVQELIRLNSYFREMQNRNRQGTEQPDNGPAGGQCGMPRSPYIAPGNPHSIPGNLDGIPGNPPGIPGHPCGVPGNPGGIPGNPGGENSDGMPRSPSGMPGSPGGMQGNPRGVQGSPKGMMGNPGGMPGSPGGMLGNPGGMPGNPGRTPGFHSGIPGNQGGVPANHIDAPVNQGAPPGNPSSVPGSQSGPPTYHSNVLENRRVPPMIIRKYPENHYVAPANHLSVPGIQYVPGQQSGVLGNPRGLLANHCSITGNHMVERNEYLPLTREEINAAAPVAENKDSTEEASYEVQPVEKNGPIVNDKTEVPQTQVPPSETRMRLVIKIDKGKVSLPYSRNEDSNEKENEQQDVEMKEKETPLPENGSLMHPPPQNNKQELYECANCTFVTTHLNFLLAHNTVCLSDHEKIDLKKCPHCPHVTNRQYALNKHINTMHTKAIWYSCDLCNYRSTDSSCLRRHKRNVHPEMAGNEQLCCHLCAYRCTTEYHLRKHLLKHEENTVLQCQFCSYSTKDRSNFRKHIFIHNPKAQDCEFCDYKCVSPYQMKVHLRKYHHGVGMEDIDCRSEVSISEVVDDITAAINETQTYIGHQAE